MMNKKLASGLQRQFQSCYRDYLKMITTKPMIYRKNWFKFVTNQFRNDKIQEAMKRRDYDSIEYSIRRMKNQIELYSNQSVQQVHLPTNPTDHQKTHYHFGWVAKGGKQGLGRP